jgi:hypothetical protein
MFFYWVSDNDEIHRLSTAAGCIRLALSAGKRQAPAATEVNTSSATINTFAESD